MSLRDAAQQALEALEVWRDSLTDPSAIPGWRFSVVGEKAIANLRAALADDAMQRLTDVQQEMEAALADQATYGMSITLGEKRIDPASIYKQEQWTEYERGIVTTERERIAAWVEDMCVGLDANTIANGIRNGGNDDIGAFEVKK